MGFKTIVNNSKMTPTSFLCCLLCSSVLFLPLFADVVPAASDPSASPIRALVLKRSDLDLFPDSDKHKIEENQVRYLRAVVSKFFRSFDDVLTFGAPEFTELWDKYLGTLHRSDLIDQRFKKILGDSWMRLLAEHPDVVSAQPLPVSLTKAHLVRVSKRQLRDEGPADLPRSQLETWASIEPNDFDMSLTPVDEELNALAKLQHARYISSQGDHIRHQLFTLGAFMDQQREKGSSGNAETLSKRFFDAAAFLRWNSPRESRLLRRLYVQRLQHLGSHKDAVKSIEDLVATVENNDHFRQLLDRLESEAKGNTASHLERLIELTGPSGNIDPHQLTVLQRYFQIFRQKNPLDPRKLVQELKNTYYPVYNRGFRLYNGCKIFSHHLGVVPGRRLKALGRFYSDELQHFGLIDAHEARDLSQLIDYVSQTPKEGRRLKDNPWTADKIKEVMKNMGINSQIPVVPASPYSTKFRAPLSNLDYRNIGKVDNNNKNPFAKFFDGKVPENLWNYVESLTPSFMALATNQLTILDNYLMVGRKIPKAYYSKISEFPMVEKKKPLVIQLEVLRQLLNPYRTVTGLFRFKQILSRYADHLKFPPGKRRMWTKFLLNVAAQCYKKTRKIRLAVVLRKIKDREVPHFPASQKVLAGQLVMSPQTTAFQFRFRPVLGRYQDFLPVKQALKLRQKSFVTLVNLILKKRRQVKVHFILRKIRDREGEASETSSKIFQAFDVAFQGLPRSKKIIFLQLGRAKDLPLPKIAFGSKMRGSLSHRGGFQIHGKKNLQMTLKKFRDKKDSTSIVSNQVKSELNTDFGRNFSPHFKQNQFLQIGRAKDGVLPKRTSPFTMRSSSSTRHGQKKHGKHRLDVTLKKYRDKKDSVETVASQVKSEVRVDGTGQFVRRSKKSLFLHFGRGKDLHLPMRTPEATMRAIARFVGCLKKRSQHSLLVTLQKYLDRTIPMDSLVNKIKAQINLANLGGLRSNAQKIVLILGKSISVPLMPGARHSGMRSFLVFKPSAFKRLEHKIEAILTKYVDRNDPIISVYNKVVSNIQLTLPCVRTVFPVPLALKSKYSEEFTDKEALKNALLEELHLEGFLLQKVSGLIEMRLEKASGPLPKLEELYDSIAPLLGNANSQGCLATSKHLLVLGRGQDAPLVPHSFRAKLLSIISSKIENRIRGSHSFQVYLRRFRDRLIPPSTIVIKAQQKFFYNKEKAMQAISKHSGFLERIQDKDLISPAYALALVGCFEQHFGDLHFGSWTELHQAMQVYLENVREMNARSESFEFVKKALIYLRPFYKSGNLDYPRFFSRYNGQVSVALDDKYTGQTIQQILDQINYECGKTEKNVFVGLEKIVEAIYPSSYARDVAEFVNVLRQKLEKCSDAFRLSEVLEFSEQKNQKLNSADFPRKLGRFRQFMGTSLSDIFALNELVHQGKSMFSESFETIEAFFGRNQLLIQNVYGDEMFQKAVYILKLLREVSKRAGVRPFDILKLKDSEIEAKVDVFFSAQEVERDAVTLGLEMLSALFRRTRSFYFQIRPVSHYAFSQSVSDRMAFCARNSAKITTLTSKIREKNIWKKNELVVLASALESVAKNGVFAAQRFNGLNARVYDHILRPFVIQTMFSAYVKHFGDLKFRDHKRHFKGLFSRFVDTFVKAHILRREEGRAVTAIFGDKKFFRNHQYRLNEVLVRFVSQEVPKLSRRSNAKGEAAMAVGMGATQRSQSSSHFLARIRNHGIYKPVATSELKKEFLQLLRGKQVLIRANNILGRLQRLRLKYKDSSVGEFLRTKKLLNVGLVYRNSKAARAFYRSFNKLVGLEKRYKLNFQSGMVRLIKTLMERQAGKAGFRRTVYKGLTNQLRQALKFCQSQISAVYSAHQRTPRNFKRLFYKFLQDNMMNKLQFRSFPAIGAVSERPRGFRSFRVRKFKPFFTNSDVRQELKSLQMAGRRSFKTLKISSLRRNRLKHVGKDFGKSQQWRGINNPNSQRRKWHIQSLRKRRFKSALQNIQKSLRIDTKMRNNSFEKKLVKSLSFRRKKLKFVPSSEFIKLSFLDTVLAPEMQETLRQNAFAKRFFLKQLEVGGALALRFDNYLRTKVARDSVFFKAANFGKRFKFKVISMFSPEQLFLSFLEQKYRAPFVQDLSKVKKIVSQRMRIKAFEDALVKQLGRRNTTPGQAFGSILKSLKDFKRMYLSATKQGKQLVPKSPILEFVRMASRLVKRMKSAPDLGRVSLPDTNAPGKQIKLMPKIFCCGCSCTTCVVDEMCASGPGLEECLEHQKRVNSDAMFVQRAASMVNIDPVVNFFINVKSPEGGYVERKVLRFGEDPNEVLMAELRSAEIEVSRKV